LQIASKEGHVDIESILRLHKEFVSLNAMEKVGAIDFIYCCYIYHISAFSLIKFIEFLQKKGYDAMAFAVKHKRRDLVQLMASSIVDDSLIHATVLTDCCFKIKFSSNFEFNNWIVSHVV
jgi:hypothetical protein